MLFTFLVFPRKQKPTLTYAKKIIDSLIKDEVFWARYEEELDEKKPLWLDIFVIIDVLVVKGRAGVGVGVTPTDILSDWLDTRGPYDVDSVDDGDIRLVRVDIIRWDAGKY